jgi:hypothetical protein
MFIQYHHQLKSVAFLKIEKSILILPTSPYPFSDPFRKASKIRGGLKLKTGKTIKAVPYPEILEWL